ncbi:MAG: NifB/NifX family molybdenum-iron cluster-binding protein [Bacillota bacterium]
MRVCIPIGENKGLDSIAFDHFGSAPFFLIYNLANEEMKLIQNQDLHHTHGMCQPLKAIAGESVDAILVAGIGAGALNKLRNQGIRVFRAESSTAAKNIELLKNNKLHEFEADHSCGHHGCGH